MNSESSTPSAPRVVLGVSGSIAAYKAADLASQLVKHGFTVYPVLTRGAAKFIAPATFTALTGNPCPIETFDEPFPNTIAHIWLAQNCDLVVIAPASMNVLARLAHGLSDDMLTAVALATSAPILLAPAMNTGMWDNEATQENIATLRRRGYRFVEPIVGRLACRTEGVGKLADVDEIMVSIEELAAQKKDLTGKRVLITAGPTREPLDPVRYLTNRSSGKMGYALAEQAQRRGARVTLITGPISIPKPQGVDIVDVETALEMHAAVLAEASSADVIIAAAAVADYRPASISVQKIKKVSQADEIKLVRNPDILQEIGRSKRSNQVLVGFAAETDNVIANAMSKLAEKNLDWIVANDIIAEGAGFEVDTNIVTILGLNGFQKSLPQMSKHRVADEILDLIARKIK